MEKSTLIPFKRLMRLLHLGKWVNGFHPQVSEALLDVESLCHVLNSTPPRDIAERGRLIRRILGHVGERCLIHSPFRCDFGSNISIGDDFVANFGLTVLDEAPVTIGNRVFIGPNVSIFTVSHALLPEQRARGVMKARPVTVEDDVWICGDVTVLPGVTIGRGAVVGAGSVVTRSVPPMTLVAGNPACPVRPVTEADFADVTEV